MHINTAVWHSKGNKRLANVTYKKGLYYINAWLKITIGNKRPGFYLDKCT